MQINLLNDFIKAYENTYSVSFDDSLKGVFKSFARNLMSLLCTQVML